MELNLAELYKETFATWRFQIESYWARNTYFASFETAAIAGDWVVGAGHHWTAMVGAVGGLLLTVVWTLNCLKQHAYVRFWWAKLIEFDGVSAATWMAADGDHDSNASRSKPVLLAADFDRWRAARGRDSFVRYDYSNLVLLVPFILFGLWTYLLLYNLRSLQILGFPMLHR